MSFEIFFHAVKNELTSKFHAALAAIHFTLLKFGFKCVGLGETAPMSYAVGPFSDMLPEKWNANKSKCSLMYWNVEGKYYVILKIFSNESYALAHLIHQAGSSINDLDIVYDAHIGDEFKTFKNAYKNPEEMISLIKKKLIEPSMPKKPKKAPKDDRSSPSSSEIYFDPFEKGVCRDTSSDVDLCPFCRSRKDIDSSIILPSGRCDLDPLGRSCTCGRGGMLFDPLRNLNHPGRPQRDDPSRIPPGSVPPGARFDPINPPLRTQPPPDPDPDNETRPPGPQNLF